MPDAVWHKRPRNVCLHHRLFADVGNNLVAAQQLRDALMELDMVINVADARFHGANQRQLLFINVFNEGSEIVVAVSSPGAG